MKHNVIPDGYQLQILSYEHDHEVRCTLTISGLSVYDVKFYADLLQAFAVPKKNQGSDKTLGNTYVKSGVLHKLIKSTLVNHPLISKEIMDRFTYDLYCFFSVEVAIAVRDARARDLIGTLICHPTNEDFKKKGRLCRQVESVKVYFFEQLVQDVSEQFI